MLLIIKGPKNNNKWIFFKVPKVAEKTRAKSIFYVFRYQARRGQKEREGCQVRYTDITIVSLTLSK